MKKCEKFTKHLGVDMIFRGMFDRNSKAHMHKYSLFSAKFMDNDEEMI